MMNLLFLLGAIALVAPTVSGKERCCAGVGCFETSGVWSHLPKPKCAEDINPKFGLFTRYNRQQAQFISRDSEIPSVFMSTRRTIFLVHGYQNDFDTSFLHELREALLEREDSNVIVVGWGGGSKNIYYPTSASNTRTVGAEIALIVDRLKAEAWVDGRDVWCVGFSLGAHTCGQAGARTHIGRITGLDPAGPYFDGNDRSTRLDPLDADYVDAFHTDGWGYTPAFYGMLSTSGHADYFPNKGYFQPGCWTELPTGSNNNNQTIDRDEVLYLFDWSISCSHSRAPKLFLESIKNPGCFISRQKCTDSNKLPKSCTDCGGACGKMGFEADHFINGKRPEGIFYLDTTSKSPFCQY